jgi:hypothetical protein
MAHPDSQTAAPRKLVRRAESGTSARLPLISQRSVTTELCKIILFHVEHAAASTEFRFFHKPQRCPTSDAGLR